MTGLRAWRVCGVFWLLVNVTLLVLAAAAGNPIVALITAVGAAGSILGVVFITKTIRARPDYAYIARMERDIFGVQRDRSQIRKSPIR
jgi:hypothetical protein